MDNQEMVIESAENRSFNHGCVAEQKFEPGVKKPSLHGQVSQMQSLAITKTP
jgi:hypothetical protein